MAKKVSKIGRNKKIAWGNLILQYLYIPIIAPIIVAVILSFIKINKLEDKIQVQNTLIQTYETRIQQIQKVENNVVLLENAIHEQNTQIKNTIHEQNTQIEKITTILVNKGIVGRDMEFNGPINFDNRR